MSTNSTREQEQAPEDARSGTSAAQPAPGSSDAGTPGVPAEDAELPRVAETGERIGPLASGLDAPDLLTEVLQREENGAAAPLRLSTILGPLPGRASAQQTRDLNDAVHQILIVGLVISTALLLAGLILSLISGQPLPTTMLSLSEAVQQSLALQPAGLVSLGLLALLVTPIVRVIGSAIVFIWERDWLFTAITLTVLAVMIVSVVVGRG